MSSEQESVETSALVSIRHQAGTDIGMRREENQDSYGIVENSNFRFYIVADGMGGVQGGATASGMAVSIVEEYFKGKEKLTANDICSAVALANSSIFEKGRNDPDLNGMGTTFVALGFIGSRMFVVNVGDSRAYRFRGDNIYRLTEDHTLVMELVRSGTISMEQAGNHPVSHMLTRSLGPTPEIEVDCYVSDDGPLQNDKYLLCSDGLYNLVTENEMLEVMSNNECDAAIKILINLANQRGGTDNITILAITIDANFPEDLKVKEVADKQLAVHDQINSTDAVSNGLQEHTLDNGYALEEKESSDIQDSQNDPFAIPSFIEEHKPEETQQDTEIADPEHVTPSEPQQVAEVIEEKTIKEEIKETQSTSQSEKPNPQIYTGISIDGVAQNVIKDISAKNAEGKEPGFAKAILAGKLTTRSLAIGILSGFVGGALVVLFARFILKPQEIRHAISTTFIGNQDADGSDSQNAGSSNPQIPQVVIDSQESLPVKKQATLLNAEAEKNNDPLPDVNPKMVSNMAQDNLIKRKDALVIKIEELTKRIEKFSQPLSGETAKQLREEEIEQGKLIDKQKEIRTNLDNATRKLAIWYGRKTRLQESDLTNLASEVAVSSEDARKKKEAFELASWNYLKEAEVLRFTPSDKDQKKKVDQLVEVRSQKMNELADAVHTAIDQTIRESEKQITDLTLDREKTQEQLDQAEQNISFSQILLGNDQVSKDSTVKDLKKSLIALEGELKEAQSLITTDKQSESPQDAVPSKAVISEKVSVQAEVVAENPLPAN